MKPGSPNDIDANQHRRTIWGRFGRFILPRHGHDQQVEFLPAALEIQARPPSPLGLALLWLLLCLFSCALIWAFIGKVDIVVTAPGRIVPNGQVKIVQAPDAGVVETIHVIDGDRVIKGDTLISIDSTYVTADDRRIALQLEENLIERRWRSKLETWFKLQRPSDENLESPAIPINGESNLAQTMYVRYQREINADISSLELDKKATISELESLSHEITRAVDALEVLDERVAAYKELSDQQYGARIQYLELHQQQIELARSLPILQARRRQLEDAARAIESRRLSALESHRRENLAEIIRLRSEQALLEQESHKSGRREALSIIRAPVSGTVQELALHTVGAIVSPAQVLMKIVPENVAIEIEALLQNRDIGFIEEGQRAEVKVEAFNFTKYGLVEAELLDMSDDAILDEKLGWVFRAKLNPKSGYLDVGGRRVRLIPGMTVVVEIATGRRRLIDFFLSPLLRYSQESLRQR